MRAKPSIRRAKGSFSRTSNELASIALIASRRFSTSAPRLSFFIQRSIEAMQSAAVTGLPSWKVRSCRSLKT